MKKFFVLFSLICLAVFALAGCTPSDQTVSGNGNNNGLFHYYTVTYFYGQFFSYNNQPSRKDLNE